MASGNNRPNANGPDVPLTNLSVPANSARDDEKNANSSAGETNTIERDAADRLIISPYDPIASMGLDPTVPEGFNTYRNKKTLTQGLMDIALFSANASQLRYIFEHGSTSQAYFYISTSLIIVSLVLQIGVGLLLLLGTRYTVSVESQRQKAYKCGNYVVIGIFFITIDNIFLAAFGGPTFVVDPGVSIGPNATRIAVGILLLMSTQYNVSVECQREIAYKYGNYVVMGIFLITVVNIFIAAFGGPAVTPFLPSAAKT